MTTNTITVHTGDVRDVMAAMPDHSVDLLVTSPPFLALRSYLPADHPDKSKEIGSEPTPAAFIDTMLELSAEWRRIVVGSGSIAVEIGDTYSGNNETGWHRSGDEPVERYRNLGAVAPTITRTPGWPLAKSLCMIPELYGVALAYGINPITGTPSPAGRWRVRNWLTWTRPNPPVGALGDKFRPATSFVTVACTSDKRWFDLDAVRGEGSPNTHARLANGASPRPTNGKKADNPNNNYGSMSEVETAGAPPLDWHHDDWQPLHRLPTAPYAGAHYATYPLALPTKLIEAMCPREVCKVCGVARRRIVGEAEYVSTNGGRVVNQWAGDRRGDNVNSWDVVGGNPGHAVKRSPTLGWTDCGHYDPIRGTLYDPYRPGVVFDPFAGSGTTLLAAAQAGRDAVGIDLDDRNLDLIRHRIGESLLIVSERVEGDSVTFTVNRHMPGTKGQAEGQASLFAEESA